MARSSCVYVVLNRGKPIAGFTVKHELISWLGRKDRASLKVWRMTDNPSDFYPSKPPTDITEEIFNLLKDKTI